MEAERAANVLSAFYFAPKEGNLCANPKENGRIRIKCTNNHANE